ncbi:MULTISPECIES: hypothetical protein [Streptomyces]|uniref:hypothetical protein n=1 Tax=Streptomyces TaxID=1883 RepID=UPI0004CD9C86|nr:MULTISPECIES: hypothetical protein [Streptomyces]
MELLLWLLVPVAYAVGVALAEVAWRIRRQPAAAIQMAPARTDHSPIILRIVDGHEVRSWH